MPRSVGEIMPAVLMEIHHDIFDTGRGGGAVPCIASDGGEVDRVRGPAVRNRGTAAPTGERRRAVAAVVYRSGGDWGD